MFRIVKLAFQNVNHYTHEEYLMPSALASFSLAGRNAVVTGSSRGIGLACALMMRDAGARVSFHGIETRPETIPGDSPYIEADLARPEDLSRLIRETMENGPAPDLLVSCAGGFFDLPFSEMTPAVWEKTFDVNVRGAYFMAQAFAKRRGNNGGSIVLVSSTNGYQAEVDSTAYDTSKGALIMMTRTLAMALAPQGIRVNGLAPGLIRTPLTAPWLDSDPALRTHYERKILLNRIGRPEDCASTCVFLCSEAAAYITGQTLVVDGGLTCSQVGRPPSTL